MENEKINRDKEKRDDNQDREQKPSSETRQPKLGEKMDIPVPKRPGSEIIIGPEGPYSLGSEAYIGGDSDAK